MMFQKGEANQIARKFESGIQMRTINPLLQGSLPSTVLPRIPLNIDIESEAPKMGDCEESARMQIFNLLKQEVGHDFSLYKQKTIRRRILRRMAVCRINDFNAYAKFLNVNRPEIKLLFKELLIGVTNFFREPESFESLKHNFIIPLMNAKIDSQPIRVWVPGCATGEEIYSLAILLKESMEDLGIQFALQLIGTDINEAAINIARNGRYPLEIAADVSGERLEANFSKFPDGFHINKNVRETIVFGLQNVTKDPPLIKMDIISCRNLLIYFETELQRRIIPLFHYALKPGGALFLGYSESVGSHSDRFEIIDKKWKIFRRPRPEAAPEG
jgi:two-component system, chemotaxis family, CheB/CheR fusion protein